MSFVSKFVKGEKCFCGQPAAHKLEEVVQSDDPFKMRHPLTAFVCEKHFAQIMGPWGVAITTTAQDERDYTRQLRNAAEASRKNTR